MLQACVVNICGLLCKAKRSQPLLGRRFNYEHLEEKGDRPTASHEQVRREGLQPFDNTGLTSGIESHTGGSIRELPDSTSDEVTGSVLRGRENIYSRRAAGSVKLGQCEMRPYIITGVSNTRSNTKITASGHRSPVTCGTTSYDGGGAVVDSPSDLSVAASQRVEPRPPSRLLRAAR